MIPKPSGFAFKGGSFPGAAFSLRGILVVRFSARRFVLMLLGLAALVSAYYALAYYLITR